MPERKQFNRSVNKDCPCSVNYPQDCPKRYPGCHGACPEYKEWRSKLDERKEKERKAKAAQNTMSASKQRELWRRKRYQRQGHFSRLSTDDK